ncbi:TPA: hypothetical protein J5G22_002615 [Escherichia coli]|nr:hypothetical protein [Escherichia coli]
MGLMASFERGMERFLVPVAIKLNSQKHVAAVRDGFVFTFPIIMASSLIILINFAILSPDGFIAGLLHLNSIFPNLEKAQAIFTPVMNGSVNIMSIIMVPIVNCAIGYFFVSMEIIPPVAYAVPWTTPGPLIAFLGTGGNWLALLVGFLCLGVATMIYLPFVIAANKVNNMTTNG